MGEALNLLARVATDREAVRDLGVEVDLVRVAVLGEDLLRLVALLSRKDDVRLGSSNRQRPFEALELGLLYEGRVSDVTDLNAVLEVPTDVLGTEAVAYGSKFLDLMLLLEVCDGCFDDGVNGFRGVGVVAVAALGQPGNEVEAIGPVQGERVALEGVDDESQVTSFGELVSYQLAVLPDADDIGNK